MKKTILAIVLTFLTVLAVYEPVRADDWESISCDRLDEQVKDPYSTLQGEWKKKYEMISSNTATLKEYDGVMFNADTIWGYKYLDHYKVYFDANGGTNYAVDHITVTKYCTFGWLPEEVIRVETGKGVATGYSDNKDSAAKFIVGVVRDGYHLAGWSYDMEGTVMVSPDDFVPETWVTGGSYTLYAQWVVASDDSHNWDKIFKADEKEDDITTTEEKKDIKEEIKKDKGDSNNKKKNSYEANKLSFKVKWVSKRKIKISIKDKGKGKYEIQIARNRKFTKGVRTYYTRKKTKVIGKLKKGRIYYIRVRRYQVVRYSNYLNNVYGEWTLLKYTSE